MSKLVAKKFKIFTATDVAIFFPTEHFYKTTEHFTKVKEQILKPDIKKAPLKSILRRASQPGAGSSKVWGSPGTFQKCFMTNLALLWTTKSTQLS